MKPAKLVLMLMMVLCLTVVGSAQLPQKDQPEPGKQLDPGFEAAHERLFSGQGKAAETSRLTEELASTLPPTASSLAPIPRKNFVDEFIFGKMEKDRIPHASLSSDEEFLRRAYLDATGLLPTPDEVQSFLANKDANKRDKLIDSLVGSENFTDQWAYHWGELLRTQDPGFHIWTKLWLKVDRPYNEVFYDLVTPVTKNASGLPTANTFYDAIGYISNRCTIWTDPDHLKGFNRLDWIDEITSDIGRNFLGISMDCFSCHNGAGHADSFNLFLGSMKRTDFWKEAAFFGKMRNVGRSSGPAGASFYGGSSLYDDLAPGYTTADDGSYWTPPENRFARDGKTYEPAFLLTGETPKPGENPRKSLGRILPSHIQFSRAAVNWVWSHLMVIGLVEPYDAFDLLRLDPKNPPPAPWTLQPANPELLQALAEDFRDNNFSIHHVIKTIMKSNAYQLSTRFDGQWKAAYIPYYARRFARVLFGPEAVDIMAQATGVPFTFKVQGQPLSYVKQLTNPLLLKGGGGGNRGGDIGNSPENKDIYAFMQSFYQTERMMPPVNKDVSSPVQAMLMMSAPIVAKRVTSEGTTRVANLLKSGKSNDEIIEELYLASLSRRPTTQEVEVAKRLIDKDRQKGTESLQWALVNSKEFLVNH